MQNIIELASGECEVFNKNSHLNLESLRKNENMFIFVHNCDSKLKEAKENQKKLEAIFEKYSSCFFFFKYKHITFNGT